MSEEISKGAWSLIFEQDKEGSKIFNALNALFYARLSYVKGDAYETAFREGQRSVIQLMMNKIAEDKMKDSDDE